jgi:hypothetical protein
VWGFGPQKKKEGRRKKKKTLSKKKKKKKKNFESIGIPHSVGHKNMEFSRKS